MLTLRLDAEVASVHNCTGTKKVQKSSLVWKNVDVVTHMSGKVANHYSRWAIKRVEELGIAQEMKSLKFFNRKREESLFNLT